MNGHLKTFSLSLKWEIAVHLVGDVFDGVILFCLFSQEMSWMRSGTLLSQFMMVFLHTRAA